MEKERNDFIENLEIKGISKIVEEFVNNYKEVTEGLNSVRTSLCEESMSLNNLENLSIRFITKERVSLDKLKR